jgi:hypothetical protein
MDCGGTRRSTGRGSVDQTTQAAFNELLRQSPCLLPEAIHSTITGFQPQHVRPTPERSRMCIVSNAADNISSVTRPRLCTCRSVRPSVCVRIIGRFVGGRDGIPFRHMAPRVRRSSIRTGLRRSRDFYIGESVDNNPLARLQTPQPRRLQMMTTMRRMRKPAVRRIGDLFRSCAPRRSRKADRPVDSIDPSPSSFCTGAAGTRSTRCDLVAPEREEDAPRFSWFGPWFWLSLSRSPQHIYCKYRRTDGWSAAVAAAAFADERTPAHHAGCYGDNAVGAKIDPSQCASSV